MNNTKDILLYFESLRNPTNIMGMARYGINISKAFGIKIPVLRELAKQNKCNHSLAIELWKTEYHECRILASMIDSTKQVTESQMEEWVLGFNSWDLCDQCCGNLFKRTVLAYQKAYEWSERDEEFVKRAGFVLMACLVMKDKKADNKDFINFLDLIIKHSTDDRNMVKKAVNWALRQIGKSKTSLNILAIETAQQINRLENKTAHWIAFDALKELKSDAVQKRLRK